MQLRSLLPIAFLLIVGCGSVDNGVGTPGAFNCNPTDSQLNTFSNGGAYTVLTSQCIRCHGNSTAEANAVKTRFKLNNAAPDMKTNLCVSYAFGQRSPSKALVTHPQDPRHVGGAFSTTALQSLIEWVDTFTLQ